MLKHFFFTMVFQPQQYGHLRLDNSLLWRYVVEGPPKLKIELTYDPAILPLSIYLKKAKTLIQK